MRKFLAIAALSLAGMAGWGCGSTGCGHLKSLCDACSDATKKQSCLQVVSTYQNAGPAGDMACDSVDSTYANCESGGT